MDRAAELEASAEDGAVIHLIHARDVARAAGDVLEGGLHVKADRRARENEGMDIACGDPDLEEDRDLEVIEPELSGSCEHAFRERGFGPLHGVEDLGWMVRIRPRLNSRKIPAQKPTRLFQFVTLSSKLPLTLATLTPPLDAELHVGRRHARKHEHGHDRADRQCFPDLVHRDSFLSIRPAEKIRGLLGRRPSRLRIPINSKFRAKIGLSYIKY